MSNPDSTATVVPNAAIAQGLREVADFLEAHPELPSFHAHIGCGIYDSTAREQMTAFADALGERAREVYRNGAVEIEGAFGDRVRAVVYAMPRYLGGEQSPPTPAYEPILSDPPVTDAEDEAWREREARDA